MERIKSLIAIFISALLAGLMIGVGGTVYLSVNDPVIGSLLFAVGLFTILIYQMSLFTGKVGYLLENKPTYILDLIIIWIGNFIGIDTYCSALYRFRPELTAKATDMCNLKLTQTINQTLFLSIMCGLLMYIAVSNFKSNKSDIGKYLGVFICVSVFILCKFEHCIADMFYFEMMNGLSILSLTVLKYIGIVTIGNSLGSILIPISNKIICALNENNMK